jgi:hypothetical protein
MKKIICIITLVIITLFFISTTRAEDAPSQSKDEPDLIVTSLTWQNIPPQGPDTYGYIDITVKNNGQGLAILPADQIKPFSINVYRDEVRPENLISGVFLGKKLSLAPAESHIFNLSTLADANLLGIKSLIVKIDVNNTINELRKDNNTFTKILPNSAFNDPSLPDLTVTNFKSSAGLNNQQVDTQIGFDIINKGGKSYNKPTFTVKVINDGVQILKNLTYKTDEFPSGASKHVEIMNQDNIGYLLIGKNKIRIIIDPTSELVEQNKSNNVLVGFVDRNLKGQIIIKGEPGGELWYVNPKDGLRYRLVSGDEAFLTIEKVGVLISNNDLKKVKTDINFRHKFIGDILIPVGSSSGVYYISLDGRYNYLKDSSSIISPIRKFGLVISNNDLAKIAVGSVPSIFENNNFSKISVSSQLKECLKIGQIKPCINEAIRTKNLNICAGLVNPSSSSTAENKIICYREVGVALKSLSICDKAGSLRYACYSDIATATKDLALCKSIPAQSGGIRDYCIEYWAEQKLDASVCQDISNSYDRNMCYYNIALKSNNVLLCGKMDTYKDKCYYDFSIKNKDISLCEKIENTQMKGFCNGTLSLKDIISTTTPIISTSTPKDAITARDSARIADVKQIQTALEMYYNDMGKYPPTASVKTGSAIAGTQYTYLKVIPSYVLPVDGACAGKQNVGYNYTASANGDSYQIEYCLGKGNSNIPAGLNTASPKGIR